MTHPTDASGGTPSTRFGGLRTALIAAALCLGGCEGAGGEGIETTVRAFTAPVWIGPISEEAGRNRGDCFAATGDRGMLASGAACVGQFCDDMYLDCVSPPAGIIPNQSAPFSATPLVSEENGSPAAKCPAGSVINGLIGDGSRSDNVSAICIPTAVNQATWAPLGVICNWTWWVSEEIGTTSWAYPGIGRAEYFGGGGFGYATAVRCSGSFCDNMSYYACAAVNAYISHEFSTQNDRGYTGEGDWSPGDFKGECSSGGLVRYMTGVSANGAAISPELRPHRALCVGQNDRLDYYGTTNWASRLRSHNINNGDDRADTGLRDWDVGFSKGECARTEVMVGISQTTSHKVSRILCAPMNQVRSNIASCTVLPYSNVTDNRINTLSSDWDPGYSKNECGLKQVLKGISRNFTTGEIHAMLCCDQQPDANP